MSIRAHRIEKLEIGKTSFSVSNDQDLVNFLHEINCCTDFDSTDIVEVPINDLERFLNEFSPIEDYLQESIKEDMNWAKSKNQDFIMYYCY